MNFKEFIYMDGYAFYVWSSYALTLAVLVVNAWWARRDLRQAQRAARRRIQSHGAQGPA